MALWLLVVGASACSSPTGGGDATTNAATASVPVASPPAPVTWSPCPGSATIQCGAVTVPVDYQHPDGATLDITVTRAPALDPAHRIGTLVFNPGGPGESGNQILPVLLDRFPTDVRNQFDLVSFDPRGTGASDPLECGTSPSAVTSVVPVPSRAGQPLPGTTVFTTMAKACQQRAASWEPLIDTVDTARDMDRIRQALGLSTISYYGLSYGTELGTVYADLFPHRIARMVLDGAVDVNASLAQQATEQAPATEQSLRHLLVTCQAEPSCPLGAQPITFYQKVAADLRRQALPAPGNGDDHPVTVGDLDTATLFALSVPETTTTYLQALVAAKGGNGAPLRQLALEFVDDVDGTPVVDPQWAIVCNDAAVHPSPEAAGAQARALAARYPLIGGYAVTYNLGGCVSWPAARQPVTDVRPPGTHPVLVIGNTGDPNTPLVGAIHLATAFRSATELTWDGWGHTWLLSGSNDQCMQGYVTRYLGGGTLPPDGTSCR